jgi:hypothetical protein
MSKTYIIQQAPVPAAPLSSAQNQKYTTIFSVGLVVVSLLMLMALWLPDLLKGE